jgi:hypothetical protein
MPQKQYSIDSPFMSVVFDDKQERGGVSALTEH